MDASLAGSGPCIEYAASQSLFDCEEGKQHSVQCSNEGICSTFSVYNFIAGAYDCKRLAMKSHPLTINAIICIVELSET